MQEQEETAASEAIPKLLNDNLVTIDGDLAKQNLPITERPLAAIFMLLRLGAIAQEDGTPFSEEPSDVVSSDWFPPFWKMVRAWYREQYGTAAHPSRYEPMNGFLLIRGTPLIMCVPSQIISAGEQAGTIWLHLVDRVLGNENALSWVNTLPTESDVAKIQPWRDQAEFVASNLRFIQNRVLSVDSNTNQEILELARTIVPHLEQAAIMVTTLKPGEVTRSYWELQMAAEASFKALLLQRTGGYLHTHDLHKLSDEVRKFEGSFSVPCLSLFPDWKKAADMRYGVGEPPTWDDSYRDYRCILETVRKCVSLWRATANLSDAKFLIKGMT